MVQQTSGTDRSGIGWSFGRQPLQRYEENLADHSYIWTAEWYAKDGNDSSTMETYMVTPLNSEAVRLGSYYICKIPHLSYLIIK